MDRKRHITPLERVVDLPRRALRRLRGPSRKELTTRLAQAKIAFQSLGEGGQIAISAQFTDPQGVAIGRRVRIGENVRADAQGGLQIQDDVEIGAGVKIHTSAPADARSAPYVEREWRQVVIERGARIGKGATIAPGVTIGSGVVIPPKAVVLDDVRAPARAAPQQNPEPQICFVLTTGRSGSTTLARALNQHPNILAKHEPRFQLIKWSTEFAHGQISDQVMEQRLRQLLRETSVYEPHKIHIDSDQKYFNLVPILERVFPSAKYIWLMRTAKNVVASAVGRSWFAGPEHPNWRNITWYYHAYRVQGDQCGDMSAAEWAAMTAFERNCWYWVYVNSTIELGLSRVPQERWMHIRLRDAVDRLDDVQHFLGASARTLELPRSNAATYEPYGEAHWTDAEREAFNRICGPLMLQYFPEVAPA